jgi:hypothetical protein
MIHHPPTPCSSRWFYYLLLLFILTANGYLPGGSGTTIRHNKQIKHITQNYTNDKGHMTHKEYNENTITITTTII